MTTSEQKKMMAWQICNTVGVVDNYPSIYQAAYEIQHRGRLTKKTESEIKGLQSEDVRKLNYVPVDILTQILLLINNLPAS